MYYVVFIVFYLLSLLPFFVLYGLSSVAAFVLYRIVRYRRDVVAANLKIAFPDKTEAERSIIAKRFYRNFCDNWVESLKLMSMSERSFKKRMTADCSPIVTAKENGKSAQLFMAHQFNWEWANHAAALYSPLPFLGVYQPISSSVVDRLFKYLRTRAGSVLLAANNMRNEMLPWRNKLYALGLIADQNPGNVNQAYWLDFFSQKAPFVKGPEKYGRFNNTAIVFCTLMRKGRGRFHLQMDLITLDPRQSDEGEITVQFVQHIESAIQSSPSDYLWSHRRWRHEWNPTYQANTLERSPLIS